MAINTSLATLKWGTAAISVAKVVDIKDFPDLGGAPNMLETTTLSDTAQTYILGITPSEAMTFTANYTSASYAAVVADANKALYYELEFNDGSSFTWQGSHSVNVNGGGVDEVVGMTITVAPSSAVAFVAAV